MTLISNDVFKVQRPLDSDDPDGYWLVYNKDRSVSMLIRMSDTDAEIVRLMGSAYKIYIRADLELPSIRFTNINPITSNPGW